MKNLGIFLVILFVCVCKSNCKECPQVTTIESFDLDRYMGTWYLQYKHYYETSDKCQQAVYKNKGNDTVAVVYTVVNNVNNRVISTKGTAKVLQPGKLGLSFRKTLVTKPNYLILGTDYDNWAIVYSCTEYGTKLLIFSRQRQASDESIAAAQEVIKKNKLEPTWIKSDQRGCPNIPNPLENV